MTTLVWVYVAYLIVCLGVTVWVGKTLERNAPIFLQDGTDDSREYTAALIHLLTVGFYLVNVGAISLALKFGDPVQNVTDAIELLSTKVGVILLILGIVHSVILAKLAASRRNTQFELALRPKTSSAVRPPESGSRE